MYKDLYANVHGSIALFLIAPTRKQHQRPSVWMDKCELILVYPYNVILLNNEKEQNVNTLNTMDDSQSNYTERVGLVSNTPSNRVHTERSHVIPFPCNSRKGTMICSDRKRIGGSLGLG